MGDKSRSIYFFFLIKHGDLSKLKGLAICNWSHCPLAVHVHLNVSFPSVTPSDFEVLTMSSVWFWGVIPAHGDTLEWTHQTSHAVKGLWITQCKTTLRRSPHTFWLPKPRTQPDFPPQHSAGRMTETSLITSGCLCPR